MLHFINLNSMDGRVSLSGLCFKRPMLKIKVSWMTTSGPFEFYIFYPVISVVLLSC